MGREKQASIKNKPLESQGEELLSGSKRSNSAQLLGERLKQGSKQDVGQELDKERPSPERGQVDRQAVATAGSSAQALRAARASSVLGSRWHGPGTVPSLC